MLTATLVQDEDDIIPNKAWVVSNGTVTAKPVLRISLSHELTADTAVCKMFSAVASDSANSVVSAALSYLALRVVASPHEHLCGAQPADIPVGEKWTGGVLVKGMEDKHCVSFLALIGPPGVGKTSVALYVANAQLSQCARVLTAIPFICAGSLARCSR